jgi:rhodanese-related sulfurtransferase
METYISTGGFMKNLFFKALTLMVLLLPCLASTAENTTGIALMDAEEFKAALDSVGRVLLLDARPLERYVDGHIKGAVNIFAPDLEKNPSLLKANKDDKILVYCDGVKCNMATGITASGLPCRSLEAILPTKSGKAAMAVVKQGYRNVAVLYEGFPGWDLKGFEAYAGKDDSRRMEMVVISAKELKAASDSRTGSNRIVDLRLPSEYSRGHVPGAVNMPYAAFFVNAGSLDKNKSIIVYGNQLEQGHNAVRRLQKLGFPHVARAVFNEWVDAGLPLNKM